MIRVYVGKILKSISYGCILKIFYQTWLRVYSKTLSLNYTLIKQDKTLDIFQEYIQQDSLLINGMMTKVYLIRLYSENRPQLISRNGLGKSKLFKKNIFFLSNINIELLSQYYLSAL